MVLASVFLSLEQIGSSASPAFAAQQKNCLRQVLQLLRHLLERYVPFVTEQRRSPEDVDSSFCTRSGLPVKI
jgi:hypothetical protein